MPTINPFEPLLPTDKANRVNWMQLSGASQSLAVHHAALKHQGVVLVITDDMQNANRILDELLFFRMENEYPILSFPDWETLPYDYFSPHQDIISNRLATLFQLPELKCGIVITSIATLMHKITPQEFLAGHTFLLKLHDKLNIENTRLRLEKAGYRNVSEVQEHGEYAVRGSIIDLFPMGSELPFRIDLFDDEIDSIRLFSPDNQRSLEKVEKIELLPAKEFPTEDAAIEKFRQQWRSQFSGNPLNSTLYEEVSEGIFPPGIEYYLPLFFDKTASLFDYLPSDTLIISVDKTHQKSEEFWHEIQNRYTQRSHDILRPLLPPQQLFIPTQDIFQHIQHYANIRIESTAEKPLTFSINHKAERPLAELENYLQQTTNRILFCAESAGRREVLLQLFNSIQLKPILFHSWHEFLQSDARYGITVAPLDEGFEQTNPPLTVIAEAQLFGKRIMQRRRRKETVQDPDAIIKDLAELQIGSPIVHIEQGVGRYLGLQPLTVGEQLTEFLAIEYEGGDKLYVPVSSLHLISRYSGVDPDLAPLNRLGTNHWLRAKRKAAEQIHDVATELLEVYARREATPGTACAQSNGDYEAFAAGFPYEETPDQLKAINDVIADMCSDKRMDRLVCGDVGFGKTEVAMRAAFMAVQNGKQVIILVPTTLLAQQHYQNFQDRFADWPVQIASLSRFKSTKEQKQVLEKLAEGKIDIVIGTHKLLQDELKLKSLGLLIIDEEHRFGVKQKEKIKMLRHNVDILTLTATPIPRTLNMAFAGIRDLSIIATPPERRLSVKTFVQEYQVNIIQEAILREILRGGQAYFLHNDVSTIENMARELQTLIPEARVGVAHGQLRERELEQVMSDFYHRRFNVLVCSTIIETGIDIPSANTIIIHRADKFGLAQLHQLRGRVGRSHHQAYAYLLTPPFKIITNDAKKRLEAISAYEDLGVGFMLATHDLEIRGAGELLGEGQSGNMQAIGFTLYMDLLTRAVESLKSGKTSTIDLTSSQTEIDLQIPALIPENYLGDAHLRLQLYKRIASAKSSLELDEIQVEMIDRFGLLPAQTKNLFSITLLKQQAEQLGILKIEASSKGGKIEFNDKPNIEPIKLIQLLQKKSNYYRLDGPTKLRFNLDAHERNDRIKLIENILLELTK